MGQFMEEISRYAGSSRLFHFHFHLELSRSAKSPTISSPLASVPVNRTVAHRDRGGVCPALAENVGHAPHTLHAGVVNFGHERKSSKVLRPAKQIPCTLPQWSHLILAPPARPNQ